MSIGKKIKKIRLMRGYTQRELGVLMGFSSETADVRMAQYETGTRVPKRDFTNKIAEILDVDADFLRAPTLTSPVEAMHALLYLEEHIKIDLVRNEDEKIVQLKINQLDWYLKEWYKKRNQLESGEITAEEYTEWKIHFPPKKITVHYEKDGDSWSEVE